LSKVHERYRQTDGQTDGPATAYSEREPEPKERSLIVWPVSRQGLTKYVLT